MGNDFLAMIAELVIVTTGWWLRADGQMLVPPLDPMRSDSMEKKKSLLSSRHLSHSLVKQKLLTYFLDAMLGILYVNTTSHRSAY